MSPILHMCHMLGTEMIHFVHQMQYYITFEVRTRGLREEGVLPTGIPVSPTLHMCHMLGTEVIHFVHQMQYYITFELRTRGLRGGAPYGYPGVPNTSHVSGTEMIHFFFCELKYMKG